MKKILFILFVVGSLVSCVPYKNTIYLQKKSQTGDVITNNKVAYKVGPYDLLQINVTSINSELSDFFNIKDETQRTYSVNDSGYIFMPVLDSVQVGKKTLPEIQALISSLIKEHVTDAIVVVRLAKFNVTVLGEVVLQGNVSPKGEQLTIIEAIGFAGGIGEFGNMKKIRLIRKEEGATRFIDIDLTNRNLVSSEYFFLQPNDILYVEPLRVKNIRTNLGQISLFVSLVSVVIIINSVFKIF